MATRLYSSTSVETTLASSINSAVTSITVATGTATTLLGGVTVVSGSQFTVAIDPDTINEEIVFITAGPVGDTFTVTRGRAGSSAIAHSTGASIKHVLTSDDLTAFATSISPVASLGFSGSTSGTTTVQATAVAGTNTLTLPATTSDTLVGKATTDTLTNKKLSDSTTTIVDVTDATKAIKFDVGGTTSITGTIATAFTTAKTLTFPDATDTLVGKATTDILTNKTLTSPAINTATIIGGTFTDAVVRGLQEDVNVVASAATGTINFDVSTASVWYYTSNATANHTLNFRYSSGISLNTALATGDAITLVWLNTNGATPYYPNVIQIDGNAVTPKVPTTISAGNASAIDAYSFTIIKTASATFTVLETQTKFA
jgi:hypothetical protein